ncbi:MAG: DUF423 domain-containing protein [Chitinophagales bacterium]|nr:DUF423 domain-containing protein [Chitinophagales bacterium]MCC7057707.1 DUF423 domain-containing protein [Chitinophagales bacterium]
MLAVCLGAFGAHGLKNLISADYIIIYQKGVDYQFYHAFALIGLGLWSANNPFSQKWVKFAHRCFIAGILCFSGSLYLLACREVLGIANFTSFIGPVTPIGGLLFIAGWFCWLLSVRYEAKTNTAKGENQ